MGFKQRAQDKQIKAQKKELELYRELLMDNQTVTLKQAHLLEIILSKMLGEECKMPVPEAEIDDEWLTNMRHSNLAALEGMANIRQYNQEEIFKAEEE
tara:strand:+ start:7557 stop:7850 length:294 start_codon:yes stop_codon:yes gene_type:complete